LYCPVLSTEYFSTSEGQINVYRGPEFGEACFRRFKVVVTEKNVDCGLKLSHYTSLRRLGEEEV
jgi:hypothetical protein